MRTLTALQSGSFSGKLSGIRYEANVGKPLTESTKGDFDGVIGVYFDEMEVTAEMVEVEPVQVKSEPKKPTLKKTAPKRKPFSKK